MALPERQRARLRSALEAALRAEDAVAEVADETARVGLTEADAPLGTAARLLKELVAVLEPLVSGRRSGGLRTED